MSSNVFSAELRGDTRLRRLVQVAAAASAITGVLLLAGLPYHPSLKLLAGAAWIVLCVVEFYRMTRAWARFRAFRIGPGGDVRVLDNDACWRPARLLSGSVLLRRYGWIRLQGPDGMRYAEPLSGHCRKSAAWRRLQVIWRHVGGVRVSC